MPKKKQNIDTELTTNPDNYMDSFRKNIDILMEKEGYSVRRLADEADMPFETLKSFIYGYSKDCKLSTAVKLARVFNISVDELIGAGTIDENTRASINMSRKVPEHVTYLIRSFIRHQYKLFSRTASTCKHIPVLLPECNNGYLRTTNVTEPVNIDHLTEGLKSKISLGIRVPCDHYEPFYMPNDVILLGVDRLAFNNERCVISNNGNLFICIKRIYIEDGEKKYKYISIIDGKTEILPNEVDDKMGYIVGFLNPDNSWGVR